MTSKSRTEQEGRDSKGRFVPGRSGNARGRPKGASCAALRQAREAAEKYALPLMVEAVQGGDLKAAIALVAYGLPKPKPMVDMGQVAFPAGATLTEKAELILQAVACGEISGDAGKLYMDMLAGLASMKQTDELEARLAAIEKKLEAVNNGTTGETS